MDQRERIADPFVSLLALMEGSEAGFWCALPGYIVSFDAAKQTSVVQLTIKMQQRFKDGSTKLVTVTNLLDVPTFFPGGGGFTLTFPIAEHDECLVVFADRCIDAWWQSGGVQPQAEFRMHDLSDGFAFVGFRNKTRVLGSVSTNSVQLRSDDGTAYIELAGGHIVNIHAPGGINLNGVTIDSSGNVGGVGTLHASGEGTFNGHTVTAHKHGGVTTGGGQTGTPTG